MGEREVSASESWERDDRIIKKRRERDPEREAVWEREQLRTAMMQQLHRRERVREREVGAMGLTQQCSILNFINEDYGCRIILITTMDKMALFVMLLRWGWHRSWWDRSFWLRRRTKKWTRGKRGKVGLSIFIFRVWTGPHTRSKGRRKHMCETG